jgi:predicted transcriptional regulator
MTYHRSSFEGRIVSYLMRHPGVTRNIIAAALDCSGVTVAGVLNELLERGMVVRSDNPDHADGGGPAYPYRWRMK